MKTDFPSLASLIKAPLQDPLRLCIVTPDLLGPVKNGGIGTACSYLATAMAEAGHHVDILFTKIVSGNAPEYWQEEYSDQGIGIHILCNEKEFKAVPVFPNHPPLVIAKLVYDWLRGRQTYDLILFMDWQGNAFYTLHARQCDLCFKNTAIGIVLHSPSLWHAVNNVAFPENPAEAITWHMERKCIEMADAIISPSAYMLKWCQERQFKLPELQFVQPNILKIPDFATTRREDKPIDEVVFFGRLEYRKGITQFCKALDILAEQNCFPPKITFLGKPGWMGDEHSVVYIAERAKKWPVEPTLLLTADHQEAQEYLATPGRLAVMPSIADNSPYTIYECLLAKVPFLARDTGGIAELVDPEFREKVLFSDNPHHLADKISAYVGTCPVRAKLAFDLAENTVAWQRGLPTLARRILKKDPAPLISVCLVHYNRPHFLRQAIDSLLVQDCSDFEVLLADDGSPGEASSELLHSLKPVFAERGWKIFRLPNGYVGKARNFLSSHARGEWLLFFDDDNVATPQMLSKCAETVRHRQGGFVSLMFNVFEGDAAPDMLKHKETFLPVGDIIAYSALANTIGDATCMIHKETFARHGGFSEDYGLGYEDYELFLRLILAGEPCAIIPEPIFWYRRQASGESMLQSTNEYANQMRALRAFMDRYPASEAELPLISCAMHSQESKEQRLMRRRVDQCPVVNDGRDAQAADTLGEIAIYLESQENTAMAEQIREAINNSRQILPPQGQSLLKQARSVAAREQYKELIKILQKAASICEKEKEKAYFYMGTLEKLPISERKIRSQLTQKLERMGDLDLAVRFHLAEQHRLLGKNHKLMDDLLNSWQKADEVYLTKRPDVAEAVRAGAFCCPLQHFILHGAVDRMRWPEKAQFLKWLELCENQLDAFAEVLANAYGCEKELMLELLTKFGE